MYFWNTKIDDVKVLNVPAYLRQGAKEMNKEIQSNPVITISVYVALRL